MPGSSRQSSLPAAAYLRLHEVPFHEVLTMPLITPEGTRDGMGPAAACRIESLLFTAAANWPHQTAIIDGEREISYDSLARYAAALARKVSSAGVSGGDRVAVFLDKTVEAVVSLFGAWAAGAIVVPINESLKRRQVDHILRHSGATALVSTPRKLARLEWEGRAGVPVIEPALEPGAPPSDGAGSNASPQGAIILYTSGSTGRPKGILVSHENLMAGTRIVSRYLALQHDERILSVLPFSFDYGLNQLLTAASVGATLVLVRSHLPAGICRTLAEAGITGCAGVPPFWIQLMSGISPFSRMKFPNLRYITNSGGRFPVDLLKRYRGHLPHTRIFLMYGLSEAFRSTYLPPELVDTRPDSMGKAIPETEVLVVREDGTECDAGEVGELVHRGPTVALGYWNDPEATRRVFRPDTLPRGDPRRTVVFSGDLVRKDAEGFLYFVGRRDKMIKSQGYRVSPEEVEEILLSCPLVAEAAVCGKLDPDRGEAIIAHVVPAQTSCFAVEALVSFCQKEMPSYMQPRNVIVHGSLPRTASGKIDRNAVEAME
jgi:amino acid adenylation domain-containing protein